MSFSFKRKADLDSRPYEMLAPISARKWIKTDLDTGAIASLSPTISNPIHPKISLAYRCSGSRTWHDHRRPQVLCKEVGTVQLCAAGHCFCMACYKLIVSQKLLEPESKLDPYGMRSLKYTSRQAVTCHLCPAIIKEGSSGVRSPNPACTVLWPPIFSSAQKQNYYVIQPASAAALDAFAKTKLGAETELKCNDCGQICASHRHLIAHQLVCLRGSYPCFVASRLLGRAGRDHAHSSSRKLGVERSRPPLLLGRHGGHDGDFGLCVQADRLSRESAGYAGGCRCAWKPLMYFHRDETESKTRTEVGEGEVYPRLRVDWAVQAHLRECSMPTAAHFAIIFNREEFQDEEAEEEEEEVQQEEDTPIPMIKEDGRGNDLCGLSSS